MNKSDEKILKIIIKELNRVKDKANYNSRRLFENGYEFTDAERARSEGYASAYNYAIILLEMFITPPKDVTINWDNLEELK